MIVKIRLLGLGCMSFKILFLKILMLPEFLIFGSSLFYSSKVKVKDEFLESKKAICKEKDRLFRILFLAIF